MWTVLPRARSDSIRNSQHVKLVIVGSGSDISTTVRGPARRGRSGIRYFQHMLVSISKAYTRLVERAADYVGALELESDVLFWLLFLSAMEWDVL